MVVLETCDPPRTVSVRIARALACPQSARVLLCNWRGLDFSQDRVRLRGPIHRVAGDGQVETDIACEPLDMDALFFYGPDSCGLVDSDQEALQRLSAANIDCSGMPLYMVLDRMMLEASRRGVLTNALGSSRSWGPKHHQELKLRRFEAATGRFISRPRTLIARQHEFAAVLRVFAASGDICILKPVFGEGGCGLQIVAPGDSPQTPAGTVVVQRLIPNPLRVEGHKADLRFYLLIDTNHARASGRIGPVLLRRAAEPYLPNSLPAEITNTSYRARHGLEPDIRPLELTPGISPGLRLWILAQLDALADALVDAYFWNAAREAQLSPGSDIANRLIVFGIDAMVADAETTPCLYLLEWNPFPAFFRDSPAADRAVEEMLAREYLPRLIRSGTR